MKPRSTAVLTIVLCCAIVLAASLPQGVAAAPAVGKREAMQVSVIPLSSTSCGAEVETLNTLPATSTIALRVVPITFGGFRLQFRTDKPHPFGSCVRQPVSHFHIELFKIVNGRGQYLSNFHIGTYKSGGHRCYVVWNNYSPAMCYKTCGGRGDVERIARTAILAVAVAAGVTITAATASVLARGVAAPVMMLP